MLHQIQALDTELFLFFNAIHAPWADSLMHTATQKLTWLPLYAWLLYWLFKTAKPGQLKSVVWQIAMIVVAVALADQAASAVLKPLIGRLRPCHVLYLADRIHLVGSCGGAYGFVSSHASTTFAVATGFVLIFKNNPTFKWLFLWAAFVSYSRVYVGVHYPFDVVGGAVVGIGSAYVVWGLVQRLGFVDFRNL